MKDKEHKKALEEERLIRAVRASQKGETDAFGVIYDAMADRIYRFILFRIQHRETAEDLTHTTFLKAWENINGYKEFPEAKFSTWLFQIAYHTVIDHYRKKRDEIGIDSLGDAIAIVPNNASTLQEVRTLIDGFRRLSPDYRSVLQLRLIEGFPVEETARILKRSPVATRVLQHRALRRLRQVLEV